MTKKLTEYDEALVGQVLALKLSQASELKIAEELGITRHRVRKILASKQFKNKLKEVGDGACSVAAARLRSKVEQLEPHAFKTLETLLKQRKVEGLRIYLELVGAKPDKDVTEKQDTTLIVNLPGRSKREVEVPSEVVNETDKELSTE